MLAPCLEYRCVDCGANIAPLWWPNMLAEALFGTVHKRVGAALTDCSSYTLQHRTLEKGVQPTQR